VLVGYRRLRQANIAQGTQQINNTMSIARGRFRIRAERTKVEGSDVPLMIWVQQIGGGNADHNRHRKRPNRSGGDKKRRSGLVY
jgi:hypothetical protein